jgi:hypothetical protein
MYCSRYYPYNYAPFLSDLKFFAEHDLVYEMGKAFLPFEQLLAVLPAASKQLLPPPLQVSICSHHHHLRRHRHNHRHYRFTAQSLCTIFFLSLESFSYLPMHG